LAENAVTNGAGGIVELGAIRTDFGAIFSGPVILNNNIVANSTSGIDVLVHNEFAGMVTGTNNLIQDGTGGLTNTVTGNPLLGPLANNGGPTQTMALLPGSPAINAGSASASFFPLSAPG